jgi:tetratricopeptide (TPR) repeat protein
VASRAVARPLTAAGLVLGAVTLAMAVTARRFVPLFAISESLVVAAALGRFVAPALRRLPAPVLPLVVLVAGAARLARYPVTPYAFHHMAAEDSFPVETVNFLEANALSGNVFADYTWGGYLALRSQGRLKVYIDGRGWTLFDDATYLGYRKVLRFQDGWIDTIESSGAQYVLWARGRTAPLQQLVDTGRWRALYADAVSVLLVRTDVPLPRLQASPDTGYRELGLGVQAFDLGRYEEAHAHLERALERTPYLRKACAYLARVQALRGPEDVAWRTARRCHALYPSENLDESIRAFGARRDRAPG